MGSMEAPVDIEKGAPEIEEENTAPDSLIDPASSIKYWNSINADVCTIDLHQAVHSGTF